jgi:hypothetical protein
MTTASFARTKATGMLAAPGGVRGAEGPEAADSSAPSAVPVELANAATAPMAADRCNSSLRFMVLPSPDGLLVRDEFACQ